VVTVGPKDPEVLDAATALEVAGVNYHFRLKALREKVKKAGDIQKQGWAEKELKNLADAQTIRWKGMGRIVAPGPETLAEANEAELVELVVAARTAYLKALRDLLGIYQVRQDLPKVSLVRQMREKFNPVHTYLYYLHAEVPPEDLRAAQRVAAADRAFEQAVKLYEEGRSGLGLGATRHRKRLQALEAFRGLVLAHPRSSKIGHSAFRIAELYRGYEEYARAALWYDRAWQWDPKIPEPVRYRAATMYEFKMGDKEKALKYYALAIQHEKAYRRNVEHARNRIALLKGR